MLTKNKSFQSFKTAVRRLSITLTPKPNDESELPLASPTLKSLKKVAKRFSTKLSPKSDDSDNDLNSQTTPFFDDDQITIFTVTRDFHPKNCPKLISVQVNDRVIIRKFVGSYGVEGVNLKTGKGGFFPYACLIKPDPYEQNGILSVSIWGKDNRNCYIHQ